MFCSVNLVICVCTHVFLSVCTCVKHWTLGCISVYMYMFLSVAIGFISCCVHLSVSRCAREVSPNVFLDVAV